jgi:hypothetical protein
MMENLPIQKVNLLGLQHELQQDEQGAAAIAVLLHQRQRRERTNHRNDTIIQDHTGLPRKFWREI